MDRFETVLGLLLIVSVSCQPYRCPDWPSEPVPTAGEYEVIDAPNPALVGAVVKVVPVPGSDGDRELHIRYTQDGSAYVVVYDWSY